MRKSTIAVVVVCLAPLVAYVAGFRIFVVKPIAAIPEGVTAIVWGVTGLNAIDSPDAFCLRNMGGVTLLCRGLTAARVADQSVIVLRLPYFKFLDNLAGTPETSQ